MSPERVVTHKHIGIRKMSVDAYDRITRSAWARGMNVADYLAALQDLRDTVAQFCQGKITREDLDKFLEESGLGTVEV